MRFACIGHEVHVKRSCLVLTDTISGRGGVSMYGTGTSSTGSQYNAPQTSPKLRFERGADVCKVSAICTLLLALGSAVPQA